MHKVGTQAHTPHGIGEITEAETVRGRTTYRVAGRGFNVYIEASKLQVASNPADRAGDSWASSKDRGRAQHERYDLNEDLGAPFTTLDDIDQDMRASGYHHSGLESTIDPGHPYHVNKDNSTTLPYDPTPQHPVDIFRGEQTIKPGEFETDADDRLHASDSLTGEQRKDNRPYPGPNPDLFAKSARFDDEDPDYGGPGPEHDPYYEQHSADLAHERQQDEHAAQYGHWPHHAAFEEEPSTPEWGDDEWHKGLHDGPERTFEARSQGGEWERDPMDGSGAGSLLGHTPDHKIPQYLEHLRGKVRGENISMGELSDLSRLADAGYIHPDDMELHEAAGTPEEDFNRGQNRDWDNDAFDPREFGASYRPAGLSNRYAHIMEAEDHTEIGMFRRDPVGYMQRHAHVMIAGEEDHLFQKFADYDNLLDVDPHMREAAWKDVAAKAKRLRAEGAVHPEDIGPNRIMATVDGDNGTYKTLVLRGPGYAGIGKGANSATFSCSCSWGKWAFKRQYSFVGRMCSHALASLWELQSHSAKGNKGKFKSAAVTDEFKKWADDNNDGHIDQGTIQDFLNTKGEDFTREDVDKLYGYVDSHHQEAPERDYDIDYTLDNDKAYKTADVLRTQPGSLTPDLRLVPQNDEHEWTDVTEDDRKTTGPDQIVHFSSIMASLHTADEQHGPGWVDPNDPSKWSNPAGGELGKAIADRANSGNNIGTPANPAPPAPGEPGGGGLNVQNPFVSAPKTDPHAAPGEPGGGGWSGVRSPLTMSPGKSVSPAPIDPGKGLTTDAQGNIHTPGGGGVTFPDSNALHPPQGTPASDLGATQHVPAAPGNTAPPPGGPSATGNPIQAPSSGDSTGAGRSGPADPNGMPGGGSAIGQGTTYHVNAGDTLSDIAQRAGLGKDQYQQIADANGIKDVNHIETGQDLKIPGQSSTGQGESVTHGAPDASTPPVSPAGPPAPPSAQPPAGPPPPPVAADPAKNSLTNPSLTGGPLGTQGIDNKPFKPQASRRYAESSDAGLLDKLRQLSHEPASDSLQHMDSRNDELRDVVEELQDRGVDASFMVASLHFADSPADGNPDFLGQSSPGWADTPFQGSGPDPRHYISDSQSYLDSHEPDLHDVTDGEDIVKFNDSRSRPQQGPRHASEGVKRAGGGPQRGIRVDPGARQGGAPKNPLRHAQGTMPENEDMTALPPPDAPDPMASSGNDLVANFQRSAAAQDLWSDNSSGGGMYSDDAIAANAQAMMRTAGRKFTQAEQRELEEEAHHMGARNLPNDSDLAGTHYLMGL